MIDTPSVSDKDFSGCDFAVQIIDKHLSKRNNEYEEKNIICFNNGCDGSPVRCVRQG